MYFSEHAKSSLVNEKDPKLSVCQRGSADSWQYVKWSQALRGQTCKHFSFLESLHYAQKIILNEDLIIKTKVVEVPKIYMEK